MRITNLQLTPVAVADPPLRNSWGVHQGDHGYFHMPYAYLTDPGLAADFWTVRTISA